MATKNLARTVIEGGRAGYNKFERYESHRTERAQAREFLSVAKRDPEAAEDMAGPKRQPVSQGFTDKLSPVWRFLESRVGKSWAKSRSMIFQKFDIRTTAGRHVLFDHMLREVADSKQDASLSRWFHKDYYVDAQGILRRTNPVKKPAPGPKTVRVTWRPAEVYAWLGARKIGRLGERFVWFVPTRDADKIRPLWRSGMMVWVVFENGKVVEDPIEPPPRWGPKTKERIALTRYRQARLLDAADEDFFRGLPASVQEAILKAAPVNAGADGILF